MQVRGVSSYLMLSYLIFIYGCILITCVTQDKYNIPASITPNLYSMYVYNFIIWIPLDHLQLPHCDIIITVSLFYMEYKCNFLILQ